MLDGTPVYDIKPYLSYCDSHPDAKCGFADKVKEHALSVECTDEIADQLNTGEIDRETFATICEILKQDPRTAYLDDEQRNWGLSFAHYNIKFTVQGTHLQITDISKRE